MSDDRLRLIVASIVLLGVVFLVGVYKFDSFLPNLGFASAGYLFGHATTQK